MLLFLNDISGSEVLVIFIFILIFFGSKSIPGIAKTLGRGIRQIKDASQEIQQEIKKSGGDMRKDLNLQGLIRETTEDLKQPLDQYVSDLEDAIQYQPPRQSHIPANLPPLDENTSEDETVNQKSVESEKLMVENKSKVEGKDNISTSID